MNDPAAHARDLSTEAVVWRNIPSTTLKTPDFGEQGAQACAIAVNRIRGNKDNEATHAVEY
jgi:hypothetical protein